MTGGANGHQVTGRVEFDGQTAFNLPMHFMRLHETLRQCAVALGQVDVAGRARHAMACEAKRAVQGVPLTGVHEDAFRRVCLGPQVFAWITFQVDVHPGRFTAFAATDDGMCAPPGCERGTQQQSQVGTAELHPAAGGEALRAPCVPEAPYVRATCGMHHHIPLFHITPGIHHEPLRMVHQPMQVWAVTCIKAHAC